MTNNRLKLVITAAALLLSFVLLVSASLAWYSISTAPEISGLSVTLFTDIALQVSDDGKNFDQSINLSEEFKYYAGLKPVSTVDGVNWFIAEYDENGALLPPSEFTLDNNLTYANKAVYKQDADGNYTVKLNGAEYMEADQQGYYVYTDIWLQTDYDYDVNVTLSAPDLTKNNLEAWEKDERNDHGAKYGSYALAEYVLDGEKVVSIDNNVQNAIRVGFLIQEKDENNNVTSSRFVIYEPNADRRSEIELKPTEDDGVANDHYIDGFEISGVTVDTEGNVTSASNYKNDAYIPTYPIGILKDENGNTTYGRVDIANEDLIIQFASQWKEDSLIEALKSGLKPNSNDILSFGKFVKNSADVTDRSKLNSFGIYDFEEEGKALSADQKDLASSSIIVKLRGKTTDENGNEIHHPTKIRMFIWIEGQDVDCWNDIADGSFYINLEFAVQP